MFSRKRLGADIGKVKSELKGSSEKEGKTGFFNKWIDFSFPDTDPINFFTIVNLIL